ncbi:hypothetical protein HDV03_002591 [Kappamyces sp. JEL0829]|nr:hypothetical protein HDV03_002591 [Kappamyces sp. JEL0829]
MAKRRPVNYDPIQLAAPSGPSTGASTDEPKTRAPPLPARKDEAAHQPPLPKRPVPTPTLVHANSITTTHSKQATNSSVASSNPESVNTLPRGILHSHSTSSADTPQGNASSHQKRVNVNFLTTPKRLFAGDQARHGVAADGRANNAAQLEATSLEDFVSTVGLNRSGTLKVADVLANKQEVKRHVRASTRNPEDESASIDSGKSTREEAANRIKQAFNELTLLRKRNEELEQLLAHGGNSETTLAVASGQPDGPRTGKDPSALASAWLEIEASLAVTNS